MNRGRSAAEATLTIAAALLLANGGSAHAGGAPTPRESLAALRLADPELKVELAAAEPAVVNPVAIAWDEHGRMYAAEMTDYPVGPAGGRIKRLEDRDGDGCYEHATVFADGLPYPNGVLAWNGGVLVTAAPDLVFLKDTDGDGRADVRKVVLTGFRAGNQQLRVNSPTWGLDNWVYLANGRSGGAVRRPGDSPERAVPIPRNDLRVRPATGVCEPIAGFSQFGLPRDDWGNRFPSWNTVPLRHVVLEARAGGASGGVAEILDRSDGGRVYSLAPPQPRFNAETVAFFNATCGGAIYRAGSLGERYRGHAFVCEPLVSVVHHRRLDPAGPTFVARRVDSEKNCEFLASTHMWFRPVNLATGPDGALYVVDFCRAWVEHPAFVPEGKRDSVNFREGDDRGRIWRIVPRRGNREPPRSWPGDMRDAPALVALLTDGNGWWRDTAQRLLVERKATSAAAALRAMAQQSPSALARVYALWTLDGQSALDLATLRAALRDSDAHVRAQAARLAAGRADEVAAQLTALAADNDARVRLNVATALGGLESDAALEALARLAAREAESGWTIEAVFGSIRTRPMRFLQTLAAQAPEIMHDPAPAQAQLLAQLGAMIGARNQETEIRALVDEIAKTEGQAAAFALLGGLARAQGRASAPALSWADSAGAGARAACAPVEPARAAAAQAARDSDRPGWVRVLAFGVLLETQSPAARELLPALLEPGEPAELQTAAARGLAQLANPALAESVLARWDHYALATRRVLLGALASEARLASRLLDAAETGPIAVGEIDPATRDALRRLRDSALHARLEKLLNRAGAPDRRAIIDRYEAALARAANPARGQSLFARHCQTCHAYGGQGQSVGPDLISVVGRPKSDLLIAILDPNQEVAPDGVAVLVVTNQGQTLTGLLAEETPSAIRLRRAEGLVEVLPRADVELLRSTGKSFMPEGFEQLLSPQDVADLIAFLRTPPAPRP